MRRIVVCRSRGFCAGVERAVNVIDDLVHAARETIYVRKEVVHNRLVVEDFKRRGVVFVDEVEDAPAEALLVFSAHGVSPEVRHRAKRLRQRTIDATCPLVTKVHREVQRFVKLGCSVFLVGHGGHEEVEGILGHAGSEIHLVQNASEARAVTVENPNHVGVVTQTTLSLREAGEIIEILRSRFPLLREPPRRDICYATENRQAAVRALAETAQAIIIIGSDNSSNSISLRDVAIDCGTPAFLVDNPGAIDPLWFSGVETLGVSAGASSPESLVQAAIERIRCLEPQFERIEEVGKAEPVMIFRAPLELTARQ